jgi:hypothetical protein
VHSTVEILGRRCTATDLTNDISPDNPTFKGHQRTVDVGQHLTHDEVVQFGLDEGMKWKRDLRRVGLRPALFESSPCADSRNLFDVQGSREHRDGTLCERRRRRRFQCRRRS